MDQPCKGETIVGDIQIRRRETLKALCNRIVVDFPEAAGMAVVELDCGCLYVNGVSFTGEPVGPLRAIDGRTGAMEGPKTLCLTCRREKAGFTHRIVHRILLWPGDEAEKPDPSLRQFIGEQVFGRGFSDKP